MFLWICIILIVGFGSLNWQLRTGKRDRLIEVERIDDEEEPPGIVETFYRGGRIFLLFADGTWNTMRLDGWEDEDGHADDSD